MTIGRKSFVKLGLTSLVIILLVAAGFYLSNFSFMAFAGVAPGITGGPSVWVNISATDANQTDEFFTCNNNISIRANVSCTEGVCNQTLNATANFTAIGAGWRQGVNISGLDGGSTRLFEFNATVDCSVATISNFQMANITVNATNEDAPGAVANVGWVGPVLVNLSTIPGCPPAGENIQLPPRVPLVNDTMVNVINECWTNCTADDHAQQLPNGSYVLCGPTFGPDSLNFTSTAYSGNFSAVSLVMDIPGKVKINFTTPVNMSDQQKSSAIMQFAMKNMMSGGRVGVNETEWNGTGGKPNMTGISATITIYNLTGRLGLPATSKPSIGYRTAYGSGSFGACPANVCSAFIWDGQNLTFNVTGFSEYNIERGIAVSLNGTDRMLNPPQNISYSNVRNINFSYTPKWNATTEIKNATLYGNFSGPSTNWTANAWNATPFTTANNNTLNYINFTVNATELTYSWNVVVYDTLTGSDTNEANHTVIYDATAPILGLVKSSNSSLTNATESMYILGASYYFNISLSDNRNISSVIFEWNGSNETTTPTTVVRNSTGGNFSFTKSDLRVSTANYTFRWFANDTSSNWGVTTLRTFNITRNISTSNFVGLALNGTESNVTYVYPQAINATAWRNFTEVGNLSLLRDGTIVNTSLTGSSVSQQILLANNTYNYTLTFTATNYTDVSITTNRFAFVNKGSTNVSLFIGGGTGTEGNATIAQGSTLNLTASINTSYSVILELNATLSPGWADKQSTAKSITNTSNATHYTAASYYNITAHFAGDVNYTGDTQTWWLNVTARTPTTTTAAASGASSSILSISADKIIKSFTSIAPGSTKTINEVDLISGKTGLTGVQLLVKERVTSVEMTVESIASKPSTAATEAAPSVYKYMSISFSNVAETNIQSAKVDFKVAKSWLTSNGLAVTDVALYRLSGGAWNVLPTSKTKEDTLYAYYEATTPGFSYFAIGGQSSAATTTTVPSTATTTTEPGTTVTTTQPGAAAGQFNWTLVAVVAALLLIAVAVWKFKLIRF